MVRGTRWDMCHRQVEHCGSGGILVTGWWMMKRSNGCLRVLDPDAPQRYCCRRNDSEEMMACTSAESHAHSVGGQRAAGVAGWTASFRMTSASSCQSGKGPRMGKPLTSDRRSCHHHRCRRQHRRGNHHTSFLRLHRHHQTSTAITPPPDRPSRRSGLISMHIPLALPHAAYDTHYPSMALTLLPLPCIAVHCPILRRIGAPARSGRAWLSLAVPGRPWLSLPRG